MAGLPAGLGKRARKAALEASLAFGRASAGARVLPSFLVVGAQRAGTTSLYRTLQAHPAVLRPNLRKGVHYFDTGYAHGPRWYRGHFPLKVTAARASRAAGTPAQAFEGSPYYMFHPLAGERIARDLPGVKLVALLRDPVERAYSAHAHEHARGYETETFERALELEPQRLAGADEWLRQGGPRARHHAHQHQAYLARGQYVDQLERLEAAVGRDRLHVVDADDLFADPDPVVADLLAFLGLPWVPGLAYAKHNARPRTSMDPALRVRLEEHFAPYDERLAAWLGRTPSWRR